MLKGFEKSSYIKEIISLNSVDIIVIGESKDFDMKDNNIMKGVNSLKEELESEGLEVELHTELMTSHQVSKETFDAFNDPKSRKENKKDEMLDAKRLYCERSISFLDYFFKRLDVYQACEMPTFIKYYRGVDIEKYKDKIRRITNDFPHLNEKGDQI